MATSYEINEMQGFAKTAQPDTATSPGAVWLGQLHDAIQESWDDGSIGPDYSPEDERVLNELADGAVPVYTHFRWQVFVDLAAYNQFDAYVHLSIGEAGEMVLNSIAETALTAWLNAKREANDARTRCSANIARDLSRRGRIR